MQFASKFILISLIFLWATPLYAGPTSSTYELKQYGFGSGGTANNDSTSYSLHGIAGELNAAPIDSTSYTLGAGFIPTVQAHVPSAPSLTNVSSFYERLHYIINNGNNPTDATFAIAISTDNFVADTRYIQADSTVGSSMVWQTYSSWNSGTGYDVTGLIPDTTYTIKVKARQGKYTESAWSATAQVATSVPSLTFAVSANSVTFNNLNSGNSYTDASKTTVLTTSTNAYNGYVIYGRVTQPLTFGANTIINYAGTNASPTSWTGLGFGYTTNDSNLTGGTANRFTSGGPNYAGFGTSTPGDPVADHPGPVTTPIVTEQFTIGYRVTAASTTPAGDYKSTVVYVVVPTF